MFIISGDEDLRNNKPIESGLIMLEDVIFNIV